MYEVEQKLRVDHAEVRESLDRIDADLVGVIAQRDTYYNHPTRDFASTDEALRIRTERAVEGHEEVTGRVTYKGPRLTSSAKTRIEHETEIVDIDTFEEILELLGFIQAGVVEKTRERYVTTTCTICLDAVVGLGEFLEVEARGEVAEVSDAARETHLVLEALDLTDAEPIEASYLSMVLDLSNESA